MSPAALARRPFGSTALAFLYLAILYLPLEEFLLRWAPGGAAGYVGLRLFFEALLYLALLAVAGAHRVRGLRLPATVIDRPLVLFLALALLSLGSSAGSTLEGLVNLRVLLRYVAVFYLVVYLDLSGAEARRALKLLLGAAALQGVLGIVQHLQGGAGGSWLPRAPALEVAGVTKEFAVLTGGIERGAVLGTTDHSVAFALFLLVAGTLAAALLLAGAAPGARARLALCALVLLAALGILFSYARSCLFALALALGALLWMGRRERASGGVLRLAVLLGPLLALGLVLARGAVGGGGPAREKETRVSPLASVEALFTARYLETAEASRLWILRDVGAEIVRSAGWLGFGPDEEHARERLLRSGGAALHRLIAYRAFEDVYWVALLAYYGFLGLGTFLFLLWRLVPAAARARARARDPWERAAARALGALLLVLVPLSFLAPTFDFRTFSFYFWLLAGLVVARGTRARPAAVPAPCGACPAARA